MEKWFRITLLATAAMNILGSITFIPANRPGREMAGLPESHPLYLWIFAVWIFAFGVCYLWMALKQLRERLFIVIGAIGKLSFFLLLALFGIFGDLPLSAVLLGAGDLIFGFLFIWWIYQNSILPR